MEPCGDGRKSHQSCSRSVDGRASRKLLTGRLRFELDWLRSWERKSILGSTLWFCLSLELPHRRGGLALWLLRKGDVTAEKKRLTQETQSSGKRHLKRVYVGAERGKEREGKPGWKLDKAAVTCLLCASCFCGLHSICAVFILHQSFSSPPIPEKETFISTLASGKTGWLWMS